MNAKTASYGLPYPHPIDDAARARMRANRSVDTGPERRLRSALHRLGHRFRKDYRVDVEGRSVRVDIAFPRHRLAVFVDGCFWHGCPEHGSVPQANRGYWKPKLRRNAERDAATTAALHQAGWRVLRVWEHVPLADAARAVLAALDEEQSPGNRVLASGKPTGADLFAGAGGSTAGLKAAGFDVLGAVELDQESARTYRANHATTQLFELNISELDPADFRHELGLAPGELTLLNACPPCQGFSTLGSSADDDPRNDLVSLVFPFIAELEPKAFLVENVPGLRQDARLEAIIQEASQLGYGVRAYLLDATWFGVPQRRRRLIVLGVRDVDESSLPDSPVDVLSRSFRREPKPVAEVLAQAGAIGSTLDAVHRARQSTPAVAARIRSIPVGGGRFDLPAEHQLDCHAELGRRATSSYGRLRLDEPAPTLTTRCTTPACGRFVHPTEHRGISLREAALLQTFSRCYKFEGSYQSIEAQIGNAVPVRMAKGLGLAVRRLLPEAGDA